MHPSLDVIGYRTFDACSHLLKSSLKLKALPMAHTMVTLWRQDKLLCEASFCVALWIWSSLCNTYENALFIISQVFAVPDGMIMLLFSVLQQEYQEVGWYIFVGVKLCASLSKCDLVSWVTESVMCLCRFQVLREIIPHSDQKRDKASFLLEVSQDTFLVYLGYASGTMISHFASWNFGQVIEYIQFLQEKVNRYEGYPGWNSEPPKLAPWVSFWMPLCGSYAKSSSVIMTVQ